MGKKIVSATTSDELVLEVTNKIHGSLEIIDIVLVIPLDESIEPRAAKQRVGLNRAVGGSFIAKATDIETFQIE